MSEPSCNGKHEEHVAEPETNYWYPHEWDEEYRRTGTVQRWHDDYPYLFDGSRGTLKPFPTTRGAISLHTPLCIFSGAMKVSSRSRTSASAR